MACEIAAILLWANSARTADRQVLHGHVPEAVTRLRLAPIGRMPGTTNLDLSIGLPFRNPQRLENELRDIYDPSSTNYHHYLTPTEFTHAFGPTEGDFQQLVSFVMSNNLTPIIIHSNRSSLHVRGAVEDIEKAFHITIGLYQHPTESRVFYAPNNEPSLDLTVPILQIGGLDNFRVRRKPHPRLSRPQDDPRRAGGSGPGGEYTARDLRAAYAPGVTLTGSGQAVGIITFNGYYLSDIQNYEDNAGSPRVPIKNVFMPGFNATPSGDNSEVSMDMEAVIAMAPGIASLNVYGASDDIAVLIEIANPSMGEPLPMQLSTSYELFYNNAQVYQALQQMARQGQTFFCASGDFGSYNANIGPFVPCDYPYVTCVGGTELNTSGSGGSWTSETAIDFGGGGPSPWYPPDTNFAIPSYQAGMDMSLNLGSTITRNCPDVAMVAANVMVIHNNGETNSFYGTSVSSPLWAGFAALVNQQAAAFGKPSVGFMNPLVYALGRTGNYAACFHDITTGSNGHGSDTNHYHAVQGYDLCTGWGTPKGQTLINTLVGLGNAIWVDFNYTGGIQNGTYFQPYKTLAQGVSVVSAGGTIAIKTAGSSPEVMTLSKQMTVLATGGAAIIGR